MGKPLKCQVCGEEATVHLTQIIDNDMQKVDLCEECAQSKGITNPKGFALFDFMGKSINIDEISKESVIACKKCGFSPKDFKKSGRFGCPACYEQFTAIMHPILEGLHKGTRHKGKVPHHLKDRIAYHNRLQQLETDLQKAVKAERYEDAAVYRDEITHLKSSQDEEASS